MGKRKNAMRALRFTLSVFTSTVLLLIAPQLPGAVPMLQFSPAYVVPWRTKLSTESAMAMMNGALVTVEVLTKKPGLYATAFSTFELETDTAPVYTVPLDGD